MAVNLYRSMRLAGRDSYISSTTPYEEIHTRYRSLIPEEEYIQLRGRFPAARDIIFVSHHRKLTTYYLLQTLFSKKNKMIHIAHNEFDTLRYFSLYPHHVVAVSNRVKKNLMDFFKVPEKHIRVIYNAIPDPGKPEVKRKLHKPLRILYPARVNAVKRQIDLVKFIQKSDLEGIQVVFCGDGPDLPELSELTQGDSRFKIMGMVEDMPRQYRTSDWVMLFTEREGLPVSLIEAGAYALPSICNDVGGNTEIIHQGVNGYIVNTYEDLLEKIKDAVNMDASEYQKLSFAARQLFEEQFTMEKMTEAYLGLIDQIESI
jgi:glycosyltransferase involved in cell wall biosynthesis